MEWTAGIPSPENFRLWCGIAAIAGALERRVWAETAERFVYPNLFTVLVSTPGIGKSVAIEKTEELWRKTKKLKLAPHNVSRASLTDAIAKASTKRILSSTSMLEYNSLLIAAGEFGVLVPTHDLEFLSVLNYLFDNPQNYREEKRSTKLELDIIKPQLNILAGTQPGFLASLLPEEAWSMGTTSRLIMIHASVAPKVELWSTLDDAEQDSRRRQREARSTALAKDLNSLYDLIGQAQWTEDAKGLLQAWHKADLDPVPEHSKLQHYIPRRIIYVIKLCMVSAVSRTGGLLIELSDVQRAQNWLLEAEAAMPDIFKEMVHRSDNQVIQELHFFLWRLYLKERKPIHQSRLWNFLQTKTTSDKIPKILDAMDRSNIVVRQGGTDTWIPKPRHEHGEES